MRHGIISDDGSMRNCIKLRRNAKDKASQDNVIANTYGNKFIISLDSELLETEYFTKLRSTNTEKLLMQQDKYQHQMQDIR